MSIVSRSLALLSTMTNRFWQFSDETTAPGHVVLDPTNGEPVERFGYFNPTIRERLFGEGEAITRYGHTPLASPVHWSGSESGGGTTLVNTAAVPLIGKAAFVETLVASCNVPIIAQVQIGPDAAGRFAGTPIRMMLAANQPAVIPTNFLLRGFQVQNGVIALAAIRAFDAAPTTVDLWGALSAHGWAITDDFEWSAPKVALFVGDSILNGTGPTATARMWPFLVKSYWRSLGTRARIVLKSVSGSTSSDHEAWRAAGYHDIPQVDLVVYALGVNDAGTGVTDVTYTANLAAFWAHVSKRWPTAKMIVCGPTPIENNTAETRAAGLRAAGAAWVAAQANARLRFVDLGSAFNRAVSSNYASSDTAGSRVHPNDTGNAAVGAAFQAAWPGLGITI
jgi:lysophospholipase L1-like esterase